ncbi:MAG: hypothetical protein GWP91_24640 [Rhodobacterales bacterium]|nr:hypothetical protein [Rhodobacterales bacterium]
MPLLPDALRAISLCAVLTATACTAGSQPEEVPSETTSGTATGTGTGTGTGNETETETETETGTETAVAPTRVLFVGNSFTFWNNGVDAEVASLRLGTGATAFESFAVTQGGASLQVMWEQTNVTDVIANGDFDVVVLQEDIPETDVNRFHEYMRLFDQAIRDSGATPVMFMAWDYDRLGWISMDEIADAHWDIGDELAISVAPVGLAWKRSSADRPALNMYDNDDEHPSVHGTYLAATTIYGVVFGESPVGLTYRPNGVSSEEAGFLQSIAWDEIQAN